MESDEPLPVDDTGSPIVGVVLMVAVAVLLSAVIGTFTLGLGEAVETTPPDVQFDVEYDDPEIVVVHRGGTGLDGEHLRLVSGETVTVWGGGTVRAGDARTLDRTDGDFARGDTVHVVRVADGRSSTLVSFDVPA